MGDKSSFDEEIRKISEEFEGYHNSHAHADRAFTRRDEYYSHLGLTVFEIERLSLPEKQNLTWVLHTGKAFEEDCLAERFSRVLEDSILYGVTKLDTCVDVTYNTGRKIFDVMDNVRKKYSDQIKVGLGAYNPSGFKSPEKERCELRKKGINRFEIFEDVAKDADFLVALAEKDRKEDHIGEKEHNVYMLELGMKLNVPVHFHVGQENRADDKSSETLFECMEWVYNIHNRLGREDYPRNLLIHDISASCYSEEDFEKHCENLKKFNLGVGVCPSAGVSMKQDRSLSTPTHNSLARIWDFAIKEIPVFLGTDNINDVFVPSSTPDMRDEIYLLTHVQRGYNERVLAKIACGVPLDPFDRGRIERILN